MSHFSTIKTELRDRDALVAALTALGHAPTAGPAQVRGYRGQLETADLVVLAPKGGDLGFRWNAQNGAYELVTDLDLCVTRSKRFWRLARPKGSRSPSRRTRTMAPLSLWSPAGPDGL